MPGVILTVLDRPDEASRVLSAARCLAELTGASLLNVLAMRMPPIATILVTEEVLTREREATLRAKERQRTHTLKAVFDAFPWATQANGLKAEWFDVEGVPEKAVEEWGRRADFVVLDRPSHRNPEPERQALHAALFATDRPVLIVPPNLSPRHFGRNVAIAWRNDGRTIKAVLAAFRWLRHAHAIHVLAGAREGASRPSLPDIFQEHDIKAALHVIPITGEQVFGEMLLAKAHELACDMVVLGAYARHPMRSLVLGGVTRHMLAKADLPVFMRH